MLFGRDSGDEYVLCPYDNTHKILAKSYNSHLVNCRKNYPQVKKVPCQFDRTHMIPKPELQHHHRICPSRAYLDRELQARAGNSDTLRGAVAGPKIQSAYNVEDLDEDWDAGPRYTATNALFSNTKSYMEEEEEDCDYEGALASSKPSYTLPVSPPKEEHFRPVPLAPSKAAQLSGPMQVKPKGSSSVIYQHAVQQAKLGRGRGRGIQVGLYDSAVRPVGGTQGVNNVSRAAASIPHLGRGIARYATNGISNIASQPVPSTFPSRPAASQGRGIRPSTASLPSYQGAGSLAQVTHQQVQQFEDPEEGQPHTGGLQTLEGAVSLASQQEVPSLEDILRIEELKNAHEMEQLKRQQEIRHQQLMETFRQQQILERQQQQQQQSSLSYSHKVTTAAEASQLAVSPLLPGAMSPSQPGEGSPRKGRGRGVEPSGEMRLPRSLSTAQTLQGQTNSLETEATGLADMFHQRLPVQGASNSSAGVKENSKQDFSKMTAEELSKVKRKLEKKLKQISALERKVSDGFEMSPEENTKLKKKESLIKELEKVGQYL